MDYIRQYIALINGIKLITMFGLIGLDLVLGVVVAISSKKFEWNKLAWIGMVLFGVAFLFLPAYL